MKKTTIALFGMFLMGISSSQAQTNRVGINTDTPQASLDIKEVPIQALPDQTVPAQGVSFPNFTTEKRNLFTAQNIKPGTMIYNTDKHCLEIYTMNNNEMGWFCIGMANIPPTSISNTTVTVNTTLENGYRFNIPYTGKASGFYSGTRVPLTLNGVEIALVIPPGNFTGNDGGTIPAYFDIVNSFSSGYDASCAGEDTNLNYTVNIHGFPSFNVPLNIECEKRIHSFHGGHTGKLLYNGEKIEIKYSGRLTGPYGEIRKKMTTTHVNTTDGNHENVTLVIPAGTFSGASGGTIPAYLEVDGDGAINVGCHSGGSIETTFTISGLQGEFIYGMDYSGC